MLYHFLQRLLVGVMLFAAGIYAYASADEASLGKVRGFTGPSSVNPATSGDYLTAVFCYCEYPERMESVMGPAHYYQFEYYNSHHNSTFILTSMCPNGDIGYDITCVPISGGEYTLAGGTMDINCKLWSGYEAVGDENVPRYDELCYLPHHKHGMDWITFNKQARNLGPWGRQGPKLGVLEAGTCETMCQENLGLPVLMDGRFPPSHQVEWASLDDMCDTCK